MCVCVYVCVCARAVWDEEVWVGMGHSQEPAMDDFLIRSKMTTTSSMLVLCEVWVKGGGANRQV